MEKDWISMATLQTFSGVVFVVTVISQFLKGPVDGLMKVPTRWVVLAVSWLVLLGRRYVMGEMSLDGAFVDLLNGFLVALTAMGAHSVVRDNLKWK